MVYANQNHSKEFSNQNILMVCESVFEIMCPGPGWYQNILPHTVKLVMLLLLLFISNRWVQ